MRHVPVGFENNTKQQNNTCVPACIIKRALVLVRVHLSTCLRSESGSGTLSLSLTAACVYRADSPGEAGAARAHPKRMQRLPLSRGMRGR